MKKKIKISDDEYKELLELIQMGVMLERTGKTLITKGQNILSSLATYGVETPIKRTMRIEKENSKNMAWVELN
jgi:hypothetical protein